MIRFCFCAAVLDPVRFSPPQRCSSQRALFGALITPGCAASPTGARAHSPVAQRPGSGLDSQCWVFIVSLFSFTSSHSFSHSVADFHPSNKHILTSAETCTPTCLGSRRTMRPTSLSTTTTTLLPGIITTTTTTTLRRLSARACTQPIRPSCSKVDQWDSSPTTDPCASLSG